MKVLLGLRRQSKAATALSNVVEREKRCRAWLATALQIALGLALFSFRPAAFAQTSPTNTVRFQAVEVFVDSFNLPLAAYQVEFKVTSGNAKIVGIEGGEHTAFSAAPFYDPKAIQNERAILAAFSTNSVLNLPTGKTRVATIHLQISDSGELKFEAKTEAAAGSDGKKISATISAQEKRAP